ncbi:RusA family crossover junction endodeoxyribonuclease [Clostridium botulinum C]|uniref:RusA family crossover junction endodeoxyribonuclease n=3 Tax=Clostridium botulinum TaxID=1491 RepID=A0A9Q4XWC3_CLOBO|nr:MULTISPECIES: RusA family crossover junction endodeoxyribonuclease [Clostridium]AYF54214.1 RusA family crossover junction endodeoxyribonuclease [Clostridium novyi]EES92102.1 endodeoxyribonuclease RusA family protein [Clostridium botulinum D str. 1873]MBO3441224.1 RusA family crossover junction endodeoxyribonuclease [Clostridium haemolyticum]MCD3194919.1 RusA family crossover junction endodeoxyribonuclease [Clostridium botulinum C]MCD3201435.1 RusA family crossover junction endodeoxyribonucl
MYTNYAKVIVHGSPITKSNFKLSNTKGRAILPYNSGKYHDRYGVYEELIAYEARLQNPNIFFTESLIAILKVYYKSQKRHPDTTNIPKSIFDGIEKSGLIINDAQIRHLIIEEHYDSKNPRFELELYGESTHKIDYKITQLETPNKPIIYNPPANKKSNISKSIKPLQEKKSNFTHCDVCGKTLKNPSDSISANKGTTLICKSCFNKLF